MAGESDLDYHKRLIYGKLDDKTLGDVDYTELSEYVYGKPYASDYARRMMYGSKYTLDLLKESEEIIKDNGNNNSNIDSKIEELKKEQRKFYDQRREYTKMLTEKARTEHIEECVRNAISHLPSTVGDLYGETPEPELIFENQEAVLVLSDWHYGMVAHNIFNDYDTSICADRVGAVINNAIERIKLHKCRAVHIVLLGDFVHGAIHISARVASEELVADQVMQVSEILAQSISRVSKVVDQTYVYCTYGNHGRIVPDKKQNIHSDNIERLISWWLKERFDDSDSVSILDGGKSEFLFFDVLNSHICATHGDLDGVKSSPRLLNALYSKEYGNDLNVVIQGDKHHYEGFEELGITSLLCGSLCGTDDYANDHRLFSTPSQMLLVFDGNGIDAQYCLKCE